MHMHHSVYFMHITCLVCTPVARQRGVAVALSLTEMAVLGTVFLPITGPSICSRPSILQLDIFIPQ
jgi:hypothetical protein